MKFRGFHDKSVIITHTLTPRSADSAFHQPGVVSGDVYGVRAVWEEGGKGVGGGEGRGEGPRQPRISKLTSGRDNYW